MESRKNELFDVICVLGAMKLCNWDRNLLGRGMGGTGVKTWKHKSAREDCLLSNIRRLVLSVSFYFDTRSSLTHLVSVSDWIPSSVCLTSEWCENKEFPYFPSQLSLRLHSLTSLIIRSSSRQSFHCKVDSPFVLVTERRGLVCVWADGTGIFHVHPSSPARIHDLTPFAQNNNNVQWVQTDCRL